MKQLHGLPLAFLIHVCCAFQQDAITEDCQVEEHDARQSTVLLQTGGAALSGSDTPHEAKAHSKTVELQTKAAARSQSVSRLDQQTKVWISIPVFLAVAFALSVYLARVVRQYEECRTSAMPPWHHNAPMLIKIGGSILGLWLIIGMVSFTQLLAFDDAGRSLTFCEAFYLCAQIVTSVGYGDFTPARPAGQAFMALYIILGISMVAGMLGIVIDQGLNALPLLFPFARNESADERDRDAQGNHLDQHALESREWDAILRAILPCALSCMIGCAFFCNYPGENKTLAQAMYMSAVTFTTVGFGAFHPLTQAGYVFGAFWMLLGVACTGNLIMAVRGYIMCARLAPRQKEPMSPDILQHMNRSADGRVTKLEFIRFQLLFGESCDIDAFDDASQLFDKLDTEGRGFICREQVSGMLSQATIKDDTKQPQEGPQ
eukprot:TRINITY_DN9722_c0_g1_i2.p1 TRINITY_DN9722_c0_g1~~TRINITY_DN9722_c0_g1_i2.p1  ORF type:complete len:432 (+),score=62.76 TRINITY_DN9722_c0_g1_i2:39-1334(+)